ncbi:unnamed protein product [Thelazia callipaeda]|uniref:Secreted protein n=1 Tax=Thelazia callipaeda TaxID=103827 RepID=A0A0N5CXZ2_THECL|nr:unnamed protein product [Thelazia callipaeda]
MIAITCQLLYYLFYLLVYCLFLQVSTGVEEPTNLEGTSVNEWRGYYRKEHSLAKPYQGSITFLFISTSVICSYPVDLQFLFFLS